MAEDQMLTFSQAREEFGVSRTWLWRRVQAGELVSHQSGRDKRERLVRRSDVAQLLAPVPLPAPNQQTKKAAA